MYILLGKNKYIVDEDKEKRNGSCIERILEYINHHNYWYDYFSPEEIKKIEENDEVPGEELILQVLLRKVNKKNEYWAYLGNHGGSGWSIDWAERYFPDIKIYNSGDYPYYNDGWQDWPIMSVEEFIKIKNKKIKKRRKRNKRNKRKKKNDDLIKDLDNIKTDDKVKTD